ncbi:MAG: sigma 54-interacting transcriptional regulator [Desulfobacterales bacterium]|nr:sigma 54-interacting transcriptional regulator [Desulfobacterales bacterium]
MDYDLKEIFDIGRLQRLTDELYKASSIPSAIVGMDGEVLTGSGWQRICTEFHRQHPETRQECIKSDIKIRKNVEKDTPYVIYKCPRGLVDASSPVIIAGEHVANVFSGQVFLAPPGRAKEKVFRDQAKKFGFDEIDYIRAYRDVPVFTEEEFRSALSFLAQLAQLIARMGYARLNELASVKALQEESAKAKGHVKELNCLYKIYRLAEDKSLTVDALLQSAVDLVAESVHYPKMTCAVAETETAVCRSRNYRETEWGISSSIRVKDIDCGYLKLVYLDEKPILEKGDFLEDEKSFIDSVSKSLGKILESKTLTQELREIESRYRILTNQFADGVVIIQDARYKFLNQSFMTMMGYSAKEDLLNKKYGEFIDRSHLNQYEDFEQGSAQDRIEYRLTPKSGKKIWVEECRNVIDWEGRTAFLCTIRDITETKKDHISSKKEAQELRAENIRLKSSLKERFRFQNIIGKSDVMQQVYDLILSAADSDASVAIYGESGTGKEMVANAIHDLSLRKAHSFVPVNCGAIPEQLLESEFFGYKKGAFTGAGIDKHGYLDLADKGSLFLDEIGELQLNMQAKLLRAIDGGGYHPIGSNQKHQADFRIITATNKDLKTEVINGDMREDFYYRIQVIPITIPPLRNRKDDIPYLVEHFFKLYSGESGHTKLPDRFLEKIYRYDWPGNVRELQNVLLRFLSTGHFELLDRMENNPEYGEPVFTGDPASVDLRQEMENHEKKIILRTLRAYNWHRIKVSEKLGITRNTLFRKMNKYGLNVIHR